MGGDEEGTLARLKAFRKTLIDPKIAEYRPAASSRPPATACLVEFGSAVDAVRCAVEVQRGMGARNADVPQDNRIEFRIGIHLGDVIEERRRSFRRRRQYRRAAGGRLRAGRDLISDDAYRQVRIG